MHFCVCIYTGEKTPGRVWPPTPMVIPGEEIRNYERWLWNSSGVWDCKKHGEKNVLRGKRFGWLFFFPPYDYRLLSCV